MSKKIEIKLTTAQEKFLKKFNEDHHMGSNKNLATAMPIHVVENSSYTYVPYDLELEDYGMDGHICFYEADNQYIYNDINDLTEDWNDNHDEEDTIPQYSEVKEQIINNVKIINEIDYLKAYNIDYIDVFYAIRNYEPVAFFFIREEAKRYLEYQGHNLNNPRVYTYSPGYANCGEYTHFFELLQNIGQQLNLTENNK